MSTSEIQSLFSGVKCYSRLGLSMTQVLVLALERQWLLSLNPMADTSVAGLMTSAKCFAAFGMSQYDMLDLALLRAIEESL